MQRAELYKALQKAGLQPYSFFILHNSFCRVAFISQYIAELQIQFCRVRLLLKQVI